MNEYRIAVIPGDGVGAEVSDEAVRILEAAGEPPGNDRLHRPWHLWSQLTQQRRCYPNDRVQHLLQVVADERWTSGQHGEDHGRHRGGELPAEELGPQIVGILEDDADNRMTSALEFAQTLGAAANTFTDTEVNEDAIPAVARWSGQRPVSHRNQTLAVFTQTLGQKLLEPETEAGDRAIHHQSDLVASGQRQLAQHHS